MHAETHLYGACEHAAPCAIKLSLQICQVFSYTHLRVLLRVCRTNHSALEANAETVPKCQVFSECAFSLNNNICLFVKEKNNNNKTYKTFVC